MRLAWLTDIHLDYIPATERYKVISDFFHEIHSHGPDALLLGGDTCESPSLPYFFQILDSSFNIPIYFVLGNHDYYCGSIADTRRKAGMLAGRSRNLHYLEEMDCAELGDVALVGEGLWSIKDKVNSDCFFIDDLAGDCIDIRRHLSRYTAKRLYEKIEAASDKKDYIICLSHVPLYDTPLASFLDTLVDPYRYVLALGGHEHENRNIRLANLELRTAKTEMGKPSIAGILDY